MTEQEAEKGQSPEGISDLTYRFRKDLVLSAHANNRNNVPVRASFIDHAGHVETVEKLYQIDATPPVITVEYDRNTPAHEKYYDQARTAYVTIRERNFDPRDVVFTITNTEGALPEIGSFRSTGQGDDMQHSCQVVFQEDGE